MRKTELFDAYLSDSLSPEEADELKKILSTEKGSEEFMQYITETQLMCEILEKKSEQKVQEVPAQPKNRIIPFLLAAAVAACLALVFIFKSDVDENSNPNISRKGLNPEKHPDVEKVFKSHEIRNLILSDGTSVNSSGNGVMTVYNENKVKVNNGNFSFQVKPRKGQEPFRIHMTHGIIEVIGTAFDIVDMQSHSSINVTEGTVKFIKDNEELILNAGQSAVASQNTLSQTEVDTEGNLELFIDGKYTANNAAFRDISNKNRTGWASWTPGDEGAVKQVIDNGNEAIAFTQSGRLGIEKFTLDGPFTLSAWVKPNGTLKANQSIIANGSSSWSLYMDGETLKPAFTINGKPDDSIIADRPFVAGNWRMLTGVYDGKVLRLYIDGVQMKTKSVSGKVGVYKSNIEVGGNHETWERNFEGRLDGVQVYSRALSDLDILKLFQKGRP